MKLQRFIIAILITMNIAMVGTPILGEDEKIQTDKLAPLWNTTWGTHDNNRSYEMTTSENNIYIIGINYIDKNNTLIMEYCLLNYSKDGDFIWEKKISNETSNLSLSKIILVNTYLYVIGTISQGNNSKAIVMKYNLNCEVINYLICSYSDSDVPESITTDNSFLYIVGDCYSNNSFSSFFLKTDLNLDIINESFYKGFGPYDVTCSNGTLIYSGWCGNISNGQWNFTIFCTDTNGTLIWNKPTTYYNYDGDHIVISGNNIVVLGTTYDKQIRLFSFNKDALERWNYSYNASILSFDGGLGIYNNFIYSLGTMYDNYTSHTDILLCKHDFDGNIIWIKFWGNQSYETGTALSVNNDGIYISGITDGNIGNNDDILIMKTSLNGDNTSIDEYALSLPVFIITMGIMVIITYCRKRFIC